MNLESINGMMEPIKKAFHEDDAEKVRDFLNHHPELKSMINEPLGPFDSPVINSVRSRAMLDVLLDAGADINAKSRWWAGGFGILHSVSPELAAYAIQRGAIVDAHAAARLGMVDELKRLVSVEPQRVHERGGDGQTPLHFARTVEIAEYLLDQGADMDARDVDHESTPAQWMVRERPEVARFLVRRGCQTDILLAAALGDLELVRKHLDADPSRIRMSVSDRYFPKQDPRASGPIYIWTLGQNKTAHHVAHEFGHTDIYKLLMERSPVDLKFVLAFELGEETLVESILKEHPSLVQSLTEEDRRKIVDAAQNNNTESVRLMLTAGWPVDALGQHGGTALHWAGFHGNAEMAEIILQYHPPLELTDDDFHSTPLGWAIHGSENGWYCKTGNYAATVEAMLLAGAKRPKKIGGSDAVRELLQRMEH